jgi:hypothetical protein
MKRCRSNVSIRIGLCLASFVLAACSSDDGQADVGIDPADVANDVPYGPGVEVGVDYDYSLYVHCGVEWARIDGVWWRTHPLDDGDANPPDGWGNPYHRGQLVVRDADVAEFSGPDGTVEFERTEIVDTPYECE